MRGRIAKIRSLLRKNHHAVLFAMIGLYVIALSAASLWKLAMNLYDGIDLAYFNQVFWNTLHGRFFLQSIHPHLSLGDHAEIAILALVPFYAVRPGPETLLVLQSIALGLAAWPIAKIARRRFGEKSLLPLLFAFAWLANPSLHGINLFEFHILPFAILPLLFAFDAYDAKRMGMFVLFMTLALLVREDVALFVVGIGVLAWIEKRPWPWRAVPIVVGGLWFVAAMRLIGTFAPDGTYKYLVYYGWLGNTPAEVFGAIVNDPLRLFRHFFTVGNLEMALGFLMPLLFLPILAPRRLIVAAVPLLQILLALPGGGALVLDTHYATLFLPGIFLAAMDGIRALENGIRLRPDRPRIARLPRHAIVALLVPAIAYAAAVMGPIPHVVGRAAKGRGAADARAADAMLGRIPPDAAVAASYALLPKLSSRERLTSLHYAFLGVTQFGASPYRMPDDVRFVALDLEDMLAYPAQFLRTAWAAPHYPGGAARLAGLDVRPIYERGRYVLLERDAKAADPGARAWVDATASDMTGGIAWKGGGIAFTPGEDGVNAAIFARWDLGSADPDGLAVRLQLRDADGAVVIDAAFPIDTAPYLPKVRPGLALTSVRDALLGPLPKGIYYPRLLVERENATMVLDGIRSTIRERSGRSEEGAVRFPAIAIE